MPDNAISLTEHNVRRSAVPSGRMEAAGIFEPFFLWPQMDGTTLVAKIRPEAMGEGISHGSVAPIAMNTFWPTNEVVASLVSKLRPHELRWLAEDVLKAGLDACRTGAVDELEKAVVGWIETADIIINQRRRLRYILRARQEGRERFGGANPSL